MNRLEFLEYVEEYELLKEELGHLVHKYHRQYTRHIINAHQKYER
jgi:hypothetical protein